MNVLLAIKLSKDLIILETILEHTQVNDPLFVMFVIHDLFKVLLLNVISELTQESDNMCVPHVRKDLFNVVFLTVMLKLTQ